MDSPDLRPRQRVDRDDRFSSWASPCWLIGSSLATHYGVGLSFSVMRFAIFHHCFFSGGVTSYARDGTSPIVIVWRRLSAFNRGDVQDQTHGASADEGYACLRTWETKSSISSASAWRLRSPTHDHRPAFPPPQSLCKLMQFGGSHPEGTSPLARLASGKLMCPLKSLPS